MQGSCHQSTDKERSRDHKRLAKWPERPLCEVKAGLPGHFVKLRFVAF